MQLMSNTKKKTKKRSSWTVWSRGADDDDDEDAQSPFVGGPTAGRGASRGVAGGAQSRRCSGQCLRWQPLPQ